MTSVIEPEASQRGILQAMLHGSSAFATMEELSEHIRSVPQEFAVVIGPSVSDEDAATLAQWARVNRPDLGVILLRNTVDSAALSLALRSGMREVVDAKDLAGITTAVQRARSVASAIGQTLHDEVQAAADAAKARVEQEAAAAAAAAAEPSGKAITVFSTKGGVGKSLVATNTAVALADEGHQVCLIDLDVNNGDVAIMLQLNPTRNVNDLVAFKGNIDESGLQALLTRFDKNLSVLAAPVRLDSPEQATSSDIAGAMHVLKSMFDYVIVDTSGVFDDQALAALDVSDLIVLVGTLDIPALKGLKLATSTLDLLNFPKDKWRFVLNRADGKVGLGIDEFESTLGLKADVSLVSSREVLAAVNRGEPLVHAFPTHQNSRALVGFASACATTLSGGVPGDVEAPTGRKGGRLRLRKG